MTNTSLRETYLINVGGKLRAWKAEVEQLKSSLDIAGIQENRGYERYMERVSDSLNQIMSTFRELQKAGEEDWSRLTIRIEDEMVEFKTNLANAIVKVKENRT